VRDWRIYADFAQGLIAIAHLNYRQVSLRSEVFPSIASSSPQSYPNAYPLL